MQKSVRKNSPWNIDTPLVTAGSMTVVWQNHINTGKIKENKEYSEIQDNKRLAPQRGLFAKFHLSEFYLLTVTFHAAKLKNSWSRSWDIS